MLQVEEMLSLPVVWLRDQGAGESVACRRKKLFKKRKEKKNRMWSALVIFDYNLLQSSDDFCTWGLGRLNKVVQLPRIFWEVVQLQSLRSARGIRLAHGKLANHLFLVHIDPLLFGRPETSVQHRGLRETEMRQVESWSSVLNQCQPVPRSSCNCPPLLPLGTWLSALVRSAVRVPGWF